MALPYDGTPPPEETPVAGPSEPMALDQALDDYEPAIPEHVQSLMGRMGRGKVYLLDETPEVLDNDADDRIRRGDPRIAALAAQLDIQDPTAWLEASSGSSASPIRSNALFVRSDLIKHLSTSKVFSWTSGLGAKVLGMEWLNDTTLVLVFDNAAAALLALSLMAKAGFDPAEGDDPLLERAAHSIPIHLLPQADLDPQDSLNGTELLGATASEAGPKRRGRGNFASDKSGAGSFDLPALAAETTPNDFSLADGIDPLSRVEVRFAVETDGGLRKTAKESEWYKRNGHRAGKERGPNSRRRDDDGGDFSWGGREESGGGRDFAKRIGRERRTDPYARPGGRDRDRGKRTADDLDAELERIASRRAAGEEGGMDVDEGYDRRERRDRRSGRGGGRREKRGAEDLDKELDDMFAARKETHV